MIRIYKNVKFQWLHSKTNGRSLRYLKWTTKLSLSPYLSNNVITHTQQALDLRPQTRWRSSRLGLLEYSTIVQSLGRILLRQCTISVCDPLVYPFNRHGLFNYICQHALVLWICNPCCEIVIRLMLATSNTALPYQIQ